MGAGYRLATLDGVGRLHHTRRQAILELASPSMAVVEAEASSNALTFYLRRGYRANGQQTAGGAWPIAKALQAAAGRN